MIRTTTNRGWLLRLLLALGIVLSFSFTAQAQNHYVLASSPNADSSEYFYEEGATLYMTVYSQVIDYHQMKKMKWEIERESDDDWNMMMDDHGSHFEGSFTNNMDGSFSAMFDLGQLPSAGTWKWKAELKDKNENEVKYEAQFTYIRSEGDSTHHYLELKGTITAINGDTIFIGKYAFVVDSNTMIMNHEKMMMQFQELKVGDYVEVEGKGLHANVYLAKKIKLEHKEDYEDDDHYEMEFKGKIEALSDSSIVVNGQTFKITAQTLILDHNKMTIQVSDLNVGQFVEIKAMLMNGEKVALKIKLEDYDDDAFTIELKGLIDSVATDYLVIGGQQVFFDSTTIVKFDDSQYGSISDLQPGQFVEVKALVNPDGSLFALKIEVEDYQQMSRKVKVKGIIDSVGTDFIMVSGKTIYVNENTEIYWSHNVPMTFSDLKKGLAVKVEGTLQDDGTILAYKIKAKEVWFKYVEIKGTVEAIDASGFTVQGIYVMVDSATIFYSSYQQYFTFADLQVGDVVEVKARRLDDGSLLAVKVEREDDYYTHLSVTGELQAISTDSIRVNNMNFAIDSTTRVYDLQDVLTGFDALKVGQIVEVKALILADGSYLARKIEIEYDPNMVSVTSSLNGKTESTIIISNTEYTITANTVILDSAFNEIDYSALTPGSDVTVWAVSSPDGYEALQVLSGSNSSVTAIQDQPQVIQSFELKQNYPNPFNPTTTIEFSLNQSGFEHVTLTVYNVLGKKVKTLYNGVLDRGTYRFEWNGTNEANQPVASGLYFYRLQVKNQASIKQMVLIK